MKFLCSMDFWQKLWYDLGKTYPCEAFMNSILSDSDLQKTVALLGFSVSVRYIAAAVLAVLAAAACALLRKIIFPALARYAERRSRPGWKILFNGFARPVSFLALLTLLWSALNCLKPPFLALLSPVFRSACILLLARGLWASSPVCSIMLHQFAPSSSDTGTLNTIDSFLSNIWKALIAAFAAISALDLFGFNVSSLITGLGLIGLTVSLAAQDSAANFFSGLVIVLERPFTVGDWVVIGGTEGSVEQVSFRSTRLRTADGALVTLSNRSVCSGVIENYNRRETRLFDFILGVTYSTTRAQLEQLMADVEAMLKANPHVLENTVQVKVKAFGDSSIDIWIRAQIDTPQLADFNAVRNDLNLSLMDVMEKNGCSFAFPSTSIYVEQTAPAAQK